MASYRPARGVDFHDGSMNQLGLVSWSIYVQFQFFVA
jgi:hypothetical protein